MAHRKFVHKCAEELLARVIEGIAGFGSDVVNVQNVVSIVALSADRDRGAGHCAKRVGSVPIEVERVVEGKPMTKAPVELQDERFIFVARAICASQYLAEVRKVCSVGGAVSPVA